MLLKTIHGTLTLKYLTKNQLEILTDPFSFDIFVFIEF
jgi:hypothetical protein